MDAWVVGIVVHADALCLARRGACLGNNFRAAKVQRQRAGPLRQRFAVARLANLDTHSRDLLVASHLRRGHGMVWRHHERPPNPRARGSHDFVRAKHLERHVGLALVERREFLGGARHVELDRVAARNERAQHVAGNHFARLRLKAAKLIVKRRVELLRRLESVRVPCNAAKDAQGAIGVPSSSWWWW